MADKIHPSSTADEENPQPRLNVNYPNVNYGSYPLQPEAPISATRPMLEKPPPPTGTYVVQVPKDQVYRVPSARAAAKYESHKFPRRRRFGGCCCRFFCCLLSIIVVIIVLLGIAALVFYLVVKPKTPSYSVNNISIQGFNLTQLTTQTLSPEFDVSVSADNPNTKIGIYYEPDSTVTIYYSNLQLSNGSLPVFYQPTQNVTNFPVTMKGSVPLTTSLSSTLLQEQTAGKIPLVLNSDVLVKLKIGALTTWQFTVKVNCNIVVSSLSTTSSIVSKNCGVNVNVF